MNERVIVVMTEEQRHHALGRLLNLADKTGCETCAEAAKALRRVLPVAAAAEKMETALHEDGWPGVSMTVALDALVES